MKTDVMVHCGNSPKMERVIDLTVALAAKDADSVKSIVREDFVWKTVGQEALISFEDLSQKLAKRPDVTEIKVENALSHGKGAMCEGTLNFEDGDVLSFCNVITFSSTAKDALVKEAHTYFIK
ncbi:hypothetical protein SAMN04488100_11817 [Alkalibacterium putridalgicola]|uniref:SnoaL-like domain-containing protein n=1 Tax=Alkalibacterium putridalgicola TaxID=426703 RepID=A0A1H7UJQ5_9LACT|nr:hypothetical protein [Alkalibacterium putridalgicola]GEK88271.1 hypothetical protein APU01nite_03100 [Alkalibacterium putridalgicola]SEL96888.1 hypothetical protein SAMN04488100_11817 [Alkalibacterium putridalgicola]